MLQIQPLTHDDFSRLQDINTALGNAEQDAYFLNQLEEQQKGTRTVFIAVWDDRDAGYCVFNRAPKYTPFKKLVIPEIQDLNVLSPFRRQGIGRMMIQHCESLARNEGFTDMGIGVGLHSGYGAAQRLYVKMGYIPDGLGINHDRKQITAGEIRAIDDDLSLMMMKPLSPEPSPRA